MISIIDLITFISVIAVFFVLGFNYGWYRCKMSLNSKDAKEK